MKIADVSPSWNVSVVVAAADAAETLPRALESVANQDYSGDIEVVVAAADPPTAEAARTKEVRVVYNPDGSTPSGLNRAVAESRGNVIVRVDAHSVIAKDYVARSVALLEKTGADVVGGMQVPVGQTFWEKAIAAAMSTPLGAGDARYRLGGLEGPVDTVYLGTFRRSAFERVGGFDEDFHRNQDYELNHRIIESGGIIWFDPTLRVQYRPRGSLRALASQYYHYGRAKRQFNRKHPGKLRWRQLAAPGVVLTLAASLVVAPFRPIALFAWLGYLGVIGVGGVLAGRSAGAAMVGTPLALATMHLSWGIGFLTD